MGMGLCLTFNFRAQVLRQIIKLPLLHYAYLRYQHPPAPTSKFTPNIHSLYLQSLLTPPRAVLG